MVIGNAFQATSYFENWSLRLCRKSRYLTNSPSVPFGDVVYGSPLRHFSNWPSVNTKQQAGTFQNSKIEQKQYAADTAGLLKPVRTKFKKHINKKFGIIQRFNEEKSQNPLLYILVEVSKMLDVYLDSDCFFFLKGLKGIS